MWFVTNRLDEYIVGTMDFSGAAGANFRINYMSTSDSTECDDDDDSSGGNDDNRSNHGKSFVNSAGFIVLMVFLSVTVAGAVCYGYYALVVAAKQSINAAASSSDDVSNVL
jgi:hypothetical protein